MSPRALFLQLLACGALLVACGPPPFVVHVTFPGELAIERGAVVVYEGVRVGEVQRIALRQDDPNRAALVELRLAISDRSVQLRTADRFHIVSLRGVAAVEVEPALRPSPPLADGSTVSGVPPLLSRLEGEIERAIEGIGQAALEAVEEALGSVGAPEDDAPRDGPARSPGDDAARSNPTTPR